MSELKSPKIYRTGPFPSKTFREGNKKHSLSEEINFKNTVDQLHKEIEKKDNRNEAISKEIQTLRNEYANSQVITLR